MFSCNVDVHRLVILVNKVSLLTIERERKKVYTEKVSEAGIDLVLKMFEVGWSGKGGH